MADMHFCGSIVDTSAFGSGAGPAAARVRAAKAPVFGAPFTH